MKKPELTEVARGIYDRLQDETGFLVDYDETGNIGKRYRRQDEIGTPFCFTVDPDSLDGRQGDGARSRHDRAGADRDRRCRFLCRRPGEIDR